MNTRRHNTSLSLPAVWSRPRRLQHHIPVLVMKIRYFNTLVIISYCYYMAALAALVLRRLSVLPRRYHMRRRRYRENTTSHSVITRLVTVTRRAMVNSVIAMAVYYHAFDWRRRSLLLTLRRTKRVIITIMRMVLRHH